MGELGIPEHPVMSNHETNMRDQTWLFLKDLACISINEGFNYDIANPSDALTEHEHANRPHYLPPLSLFYYITSRHGQINPGNYLHPKYAAHAAT